MSIDSSGARLLIVDDDPLLRSMASKTLRHAGFNVAEAEGGAPALALFEQASFDLLLLDVMMPDMDGFEVCTRVRRMQHGTRVPILMLTGLNDTDSIERAYQAGATDFIPKPINWTLLSHRVRYALRATAAAESEIRSRKRLERAQHIATMGRWELSIDDRRFDCSPELARVFGAPAGAIPFDSEEAFLARVCDADREMVRAARSAAESEGKPYQLTFCIEHYDQTPRTVFEQAAPVFDGAGRQVAVEGVTQDITERVEAERRISHLAHYDALTGLPNRQFFAELAMPVLERSMRLGTSCALLHLDLDRFKSVNDAFGHAEGDAVLHTISERLQASLRASDIVSVGRVISRDSVFARVGANAFTLLLADIGNEQLVVTVAERLLHAVSVPLTVGDREWVLTASIGIALYPRDAVDSRDLIRCSEQAVYAAKEAGRARQQFFDEKMNAQASARLAQESDLRRGIADGQLRLYYQPKVDAASGVILGAEALVRWQHPERGLVPPGQFISLAEESGLILPLTDWVLETACADLRRRADAGLPALPVSVNLASPSFVHDDLPAQLQALMKKDRLAASCLTLEVTESLLMAQVERAVERLQALREMGFGLSLDDFGTGYSSLSYLKRFPIDELKIDRSFVIDVSKGGRDGALAAAIIALGREFRLRVIAEGVETLEQATFLLDHGCAHQQGFLFARPMPVHEFDALLVTGAMPTVTPLRAAAAPGKLARYQSAK